MPTQGTTIPAVKGETGMPMQSIHSTIIGTAIHGIQIYFNQREALNEHYEHI